MDKMAWVMIAATVAAGAIAELIRRARDGGPDKTATVMISLVCCVVVAMIISMFDSTGLHRRGSGNDVTFFIIPVVLIVVCLILMWVRMRRK